MFIGGVRSIIISIVLNANVVCKKNQVTQKNIKYNWAKNRPLWDSEKVFHSRSYRRYLFWLFVFFLVNKNWILFVK